MIIIFLETTESITIERMALSLWSNIKRVKEERKYYVYACSGSGTMKFLSSNELLGFIDVISLCVGNIISKISNIAYIHYRDLC